MTAEILALQQLLEVERKAYGVELQSAGCERYRLDVSFVADAELCDWEDLEALRVNIAVDNALVVQVG